RVGQLPRRQIDGRERHHRTRLAILEDREVFSRQPAYGQAIAVEYRDVDVNEVDTCAKDRLPGDDTRSDEAKQPGGQGRKHTPHKNPILLESRAVYRRRVRTA